MEAAGAAVRRGGGRRVGAAPPGGRARAAARAVRRGRAVRGGARAPAVPLLRRRAAAAAAPARAAGPHGRQPALRPRLRPRALRQPGPAQGLAGLRHRFRLVYMFDCILYSSENCHRSSSALKRIKLTSVIILKVVFFIDDSFSTVRTISSSFSTLAK